MGLFEEPLADLSLVNQLGSQVALDKLDTILQAILIHAGNWLILSFLLLIISQEHRELAREAVRKSLVLLKNGESADKPLLPLPKKASKILVASSHAHNLGYRCRGWTMEWQGLSGNNLTQRR